jgi:hypothetical protein
MIDQSFIHLGCDGSLTSWSTCQLKSSPQRPDAAVVVLRQLSELPERSVAFRQPKRNKKYVYNLIKLIDAQ